MASSFFWNVRGFNKGNKHLVFKKWVMEKDLQFGDVIETRVKEGKCLGIASKVFPEWSVMDNYE